MILMIMDIEGFLGFDIGKQNLNSSKHLDKYLHQIKQYCCCYFTYFCILVLLVLLFVVIYIGLTFFWLSLN